MLCARISSLCTLAIRTGAKKILVVRTPRKDVMERTMQWRHNHTAGHRHRNCRNPFILKSSWLLHEHTGNPTRNTGRPRLVLYQNLQNFLVLLNIRGLFPLSACINRFTASTEVHSGLKVDTKQKICQMIVNQTKRQSDEVFYWSSS
jgi:hypothetical protein